MKNDKIYDTIPTRLRIPASPFYFVALVATNLQAQPITPNLNLTHPVPATNTLITSSTLLISDESMFSGRNIETTLAKSVEDDFTTEVYIKPQYVNTFRIKAKSIKIDKSLPKVFLD